MSGQLSKDQATLLAEFIHALRPEWDVAGIVHALGTVRDRGDAYTVAVTAILAAQNAANRTPGVIPLSGPHWAATGTSRPRPVVPPRHKTCATCYLAEDECRRRWHWDHDFESIPQAQARAIRVADGIPKVLKPAYLDGRHIKDVELP